MDINVFKEVQHFYERNQFNEKYDGKNVNMVCIFVYIVYE